MQVFTCKIDNGFMEFCLEIIFVPLVSFFIYGKIVTVEKMNSKIDLILGVFKIQISEVSIILSYWKNCLSMPVELRMLRNFWKNLEYLFIDRKKFVTLLIVPTRIQIPSFALHFLNICAHQYSIRNLSAFQKTSLY